MSFTQNDERKVELPDKQGLGLQDLSQDIEIRPPKSILLKHKSGKRPPENFKLYTERDLEFLFHPTETDGTRLIDFNIEKLEQEYDYDTDEG